MLTLSRKEGERIMIGDGIVIEVADIRHNQVKLRITAPGLPVDREEIWERKRNSAYKTPDDGGGLSMSQGGPAFPNVPSDPAYVRWDEGMSLLEYYAGKALPQCIDMMRAAARKAGGAGFDFDNSPSNIAGAAFDIAEAMVAEALKRRGGAV